MADQGDTFESSDDAEGNLTMEPIESIVNESTRSYQPSTSGTSDDTSDRIIDQMIDRDSNNDVSIRYTTLLLQDHGIDSNLSEYDSEPTNDNEFHLPLGHARLLPFNNALALYQGRPGSSCIAHPWDELSITDIIGLFSNSLDIYRPPPQESQGVEDTRPHDMMIIVRGINIGPRNNIINDENNHSDAVEMTVPPVPIALNFSTSETSDTTARIPNELSQDYDLPTDTNERQNDNESDTSSDDEQCLPPESVSYVDSEDEDDELTHSGNQRGNTLPNLATILNNEQSVATTLTNDSSSPQMPVNERDVRVSTDDGPKMILTQTNSPIIDGPKLPTSDNSSDESTEEVDASN